MRRSSRRTRATRWTSSQRPTPAGRLRRMQRYPGVKTVRDGGAVLALAGDLDLVVLGTPPATHFPLAKAALEAGLDVVVDKPFAVSSAQGRELIVLAERLGRVLTVFHNRRWDGDFLTVRKLLAGGSAWAASRASSPASSAGRRQFPRRGRPVPRPATAAACCSTSARI